MPQAERLLFAPAVWRLTPVSQVNGIATLTLAGVAGMIHYITGYSISASAAPAAAVSATISGGAAVLDQVEIPAAVIAPIVRNYSRPLEGLVGEAASITLPALGGTTRGTVALFGFSTAA